MGMRKMFGRLIVAFCLLLTAYCFLAFGQGGTGKMPPQRMPNPPRRNPPPRNNPPPPTQSSCSAKSPTKATGRTRAVNLQGGVKLEMVEVPAGNFCMGSNSGKADEKPVHRVTISRAFYIGKYEVTQAQWKGEMGNNPSQFNGDALPVEQVSWDDAQRFINKLNELRDGFSYRLPTEAEWEYACRAGTTTDFAFGNSLSLQEANFGDNAYLGKGLYRRKTSPVGAFQPNAFGLYDMHGNVNEWCQDFHDANYYRDAPGTDPQGPSKGQYRMIRGGSWIYDTANSRSAARMSGPPDFRVSHQGDIGFRVVAVARTN